MDKAKLNKELQTMGMDREYTIHATAAEDDWGHTFSSKDIMKLCKDLGIPRKVRIMAPQSKYFGQDLPVVSQDYWGGSYQVKLYELSNKRRAYTFPNEKIRISDETIAAFKLSCRTHDKPADYIGRDFSAEDIIFLRQFFRVKKVFGGFMLIAPIDNDFLRHIKNAEARQYLIIDDPIIHLHI